MAGYAVGFGPYVGFYHQPQFGRPALALDITLLELRVAISAFGLSWLPFILHDSLRSAGIPPPSPGTEDTNCDGRMLNRRSPYGIWTIYTLFAKMAVVG